VLGLREAQAGGRILSARRVVARSRRRAHPPSRTPSRRSIDRPHGSSVSRCRQAARAADGAIAQASRLCVCSAPSAERSGPTATVCLLCAFGVKAPWRCRKTRRNESPGGAGAFKHKNCASDTSCRACHLIHCAASTAYRRMVFRALSRSAPRSVHAFDLKKASTFSRLSHSVIATRAGGRRVPSFHDNLPLAQTTSASRPLEPCFGRDGGANQNILAAWLCRATCSRRPRLSAAAGSHAAARPCRNTRGRNGGF
jgi:hypothetical protein